MRERRSDIPLLIDHFLDRLGKKLGKSLERVSKESLDRLMRYDWPGNVREFLNVIERAAILARGRVVHIEDSLDLRLKSPSDAMPTNNPATISGTIVIESSLMNIVPSGSTRI